MNDITSSAGMYGEVHQNLISLILHSKAMTFAATTSALTYLTAYSNPYMVQAAASVPQVINFIGTHGPTAYMSWADIMAFFSFCLVLANLSVFVSKAVGAIKKKFSKRRKL